MTFDWDEIFTPSILQPSPSHSPPPTTPLRNTLPLTTITTNCLNDQLLELLLQHAPALQQISVCSMDIDEDYSGDHWAVREVSFVPMGGEQPYGSWYGVSRLPRNLAETVDVRGPMGAEVRSCACFSVYEGLCML